MHQVVEECLYAAVEATKDARRQHRRYPFFRPAMIAATDDRATQRPAFIRDISPTGIGLLHTFALDTQRVMVTIPSLSDHPLDIGAELKWSMPAGGDGTSAVEDFSIWR
jgi:hypothetical protein